MNNAFIKVDPSASTSPNKDGLFFKLSPIDETYSFKSSSSKVKHYEIIWIFSGVGSRIVEFDEFLLKPHRLFFLYPGSVQTWKNVSQVLGIHITFSEEFLLYTWQHSTPKTIPFFSFINNISFIDIEDKENIYALLDLLKKEYKINTHHNYEIISSYLKILLSKLLYKPDIETSVPTNSFISKFEQLLEKNFYTHQNVEDYAKFVHLSPNYLNDLIRNKTGKSVGWWIRKRRLVESKRRLLFSADSISKIASDLNFNDISYFCRFFKKYTDQSPLQFRRSVEK